MVDLGFEIDSDCDFKIIVTSLSHSDVIARQNFCPKKQSATLKHLATEQDINLYLPEVTTMSQITGGMIDFSQNSLYSKHPPRILFNQT